MDCLTALILPGDSSRDGHIGETHTTYFVANVVITAFAVVKAVSWISLLLLPSALTEPYWRVAPSFGYIFMLVAYTVDLHLTSESSAYLMVWLVWAGVWAWIAGRLWRLWSKTVRCCTRRCRAATTGKEVGVACGMLCLSLLVISWYVQPLSRDYAKNCPAGAPGYWGLTLYSLPLGLVLWLGSNGLRRSQARGGARFAFKSPLYDANSIDSRRQWLVSSE